MVLRVGPGEPLVRQALQAKAAQARAAQLARLAAQRRLASSAAPDVRPAKPQSVASQAQTKAEGDGTAAPTQGERASAWLGHARLTASMGPSEAQLRRLANEAELPQVLLPPPSTGVNVARLQRVRERIEFARAQLATDATERGSSQPEAAPAKGPADAPGCAVDPLSGELAGADLLQHLVGSAFAPSDLPYLRRRLGLSPRIERAFGALYGRPSEPATSSTAAPPSGLPGRITEALRFTLRRKAEPPAAPPAPPQAKPSAQATRALPPSMSWSAFAALLTQRQLRALLDLAVLRLRDVGLQNASEFWARLAERERTQQEVASERLTQVVDFINTTAFARACWASGKASPLRNARPYGRGQGAIEPLDGREASTARAELRRAEALLARRRGLAAANGRLADAGQVLDWVPAEGGRPAQALRRVALTAAEIDGLGENERAAHAATSERLRRLERHDASSTFGRLVLSTAQLTQAAERCQRAAVAATGPRAAEFAMLAQRYRDRAQDHAERAQRCGYFEAIAAVGRRQRLELAQSMVAEAQQLEPAVRRHQALQADANDAQLAADERATARAQAAEVEVEIEDRRLRLTGMHAAVTLANDVRPPGEGPLPEILRTMWRGHRPLDPDSDGPVDRAHARAFEPLRDAIVAPGTELLGDGGATDHLRARGEAAAAWAKDYRDVGFSRLQDFNRIASAAPRSIAPTAQVVSRQAQNALEDMASYFEGGRNEFYQALGREQGATQALVGRLREIDRISG